MDRDFIGTDLLGDGDVSSDELQKLKEAIAEAEAAAAKRTNAQEEAE